MPEIVKVNQAWDMPDQRDYVFDDFIKLKEQNEEASIGEVKRPRDEVEVQNQGQLPSCTVFGATHIHNGLNILEDRRYGKTRKQAKAKLLRDAFCKFRGYTNGGSAIQTVSNWFKSSKYIVGYVSIVNSTPLDEMIKQMKQTIDMGSFIYTGSPFGNWNNIKQTGVYEESNPKYFLGHAYGIVDYELNDDGTVKFFWAINSYGSTWSKHDGYFKIMAEDVKKLYTKIVFIDFDDKDIFAKLQEVEKLKQAIVLLREVYAIADQPVRDYFDKIQMGANFSKLYNTTI